jgi:EAL domain-containing protein (putative c-di-GMP-specific phosphodiesterase class I)
MRWHHDGAVVPPSRFITVAEETGAINELGEWILRDACRQTLARQRELNLPGLTIAVNVSGCQLIHPEFVTVLTDVLAETGIAPETLALEITESTLIRDDDSTLERLHVLHATGVRISIDDFGTGYSSLSYLRQLPVDIIKIDRSFVSQIDDHPQTVEIVRAITTLAHSLNLVVVGEGIETVTQLHTLSALDCDCAQGFLFARPGLPKATASVLQHGFRPTDDIDPRSGRQPALSVARGTRRDSLI